MNTTFSDYVSMVSAILYTYIDRRIIAHDMHTPILNSGQTFFNIYIYVRLKINRFLFTVNKQIDDIILCVAQYGNQQK
jgi:hypothetical protein